MSELKGKYCLRAFTLVEVVMAVSILAMIASGVVVVMNRCIETTIDSQAQMEAFELARENMEKLLASESVMDMAEFGVLEGNEDIRWETVVESFYEPLTSRMWIQAVCSATYTDSAGEYQTVKLTHWLTDVTKAQLRQILEQQKLESEFQEQYNYEMQARIIAEKTGISLDQAYDILDNPDKEAAAEELAEATGISPDEADAILEEAEATAPTSPVEPDVEPTERPDINLNLLVSILKAVNMTDGECREVLSDLGYAGTEIDEIMVKINAK